MKQLNLFDGSDRSSLRPCPETMVMDKEALQKGKQRIYEPQQKVRSSQTPQPTVLFEIPRPTWQTADEIDPFSLRAYPAEFSRRPEPPETLDESN